MIHFTKLFCHMQQEEETMVGVGVGGGGHDKASLSFFKASVSYCFYTKINKQKLTSVSSVMATYNVSVS